MNKIVKKFLAVLILSIILFSQAGFVLADEGDLCCSDGDCGGLKCFCIPDPPDPDCDVTTDPGNPTGQWGTCHSAGSVVICSPLKYRSISAVIESITNWIFYIAIVLAPLMIIIGAFMFMTSAGDPTKVQTAKKLIIWTVIGFAIILFSKGLISLIRTILGA